MKINFEWHDSISLTENLKQPIENKFRDDLKNRIPKNIKEVIVLFNQHKPMPTISGAINDVYGKTLYSFVHNPLGKNCDTVYTEYE